jgi:hypothetical protein
MVILLLVTTSTLMPSSVMPTLAFPKTPTYGPSLFDAAADAYPHAAVIRRLKLL